MICIIGNCQMASIADVLRQKTSVFYLNPVSTLTFGATGDVPKELSEKLQELNLTNVIHPLQNQFPNPFMRDCKPDLFVINLYHEFDNLFQHNKDGYPLYVQPDLVDFSPDFAQYLDTCFHEITPTLEGYLNRFKKAVIEMRGMFNDVPILIIKRLSYNPFFGPSPISCLASWKDLWEDAPEVLGLFAESVDDCRILDMDQVFLEHLHKTGTTIDRLCPYHYLNVSETIESNMTGIHFQRDVEHIHTDFWERMAGKVFDYFQTKSISDPEGGGVLNEGQFRRDTKDDVSDQKCETFLESGDSFTMARAIRHLMYSPNDDHSEMLVEFADKFVFDGALFQQLYQYSKVLKEGRVLDWLGLMEERVKKEIQDPVAARFFTRYIRGMEKHVQQNKKMFPNRKFYIEG